MAMSQSEQKFRTMSTIQRNTLISLVPPKINTYIAPKLWEEIAMKLNRLPGPRRDWKTWRKSWYHLKSRALQDEPENEQQPTPFHSNQPVYQNTAIVTPQRRIEPPGSASHAMDTAPYQPPTQSMLSSDTEFHRHPSQAEFDEIFLDNAHNFCPEENMAHRIDNVMPSTSGTWLPDTQTLPSPFPHESNVTHRPPYNNEQPQGNYEPGTNSRLYDLLMTPITSPTYEEPVPNTADRDNGIWIMENNTEVGKQRNEILKAYYADKLHNTITYRKKMLEMKQCQLDMMDKQYRMLKRIAEALEEQSDEEQDEQDEQQEENVTN